MITLTKEDLFEIKVLRDSLQNKVNSEVMESKTKGVRTGSQSAHYRTTEAERNAQHGVDVLNKILNQA